MKRLSPGRGVHLTSPDKGRLACRVVAVAGSWALLSVPDPSAALPEWLEGEVFLVLFEGAHPVRLRGVAEPGRLPGEIRFSVSTGTGHPEARTAPRVPIALHAAIQGPSGEWLDGETVDVAAGGVRIRHADRLGSTDRARVQLALPRGPMVDADVVVRDEEAGLSVLVFAHFHSGCTQTVAEWCVDELRRRTGAPRRAGRPEGRTVAPPSATRT